MKELGFVFYSFFLYNKLRIPSIKRGINAMATIMNIRGREILQILLQNDHYIKVEDIACQMNVSKRSIYYDIYHINDWLTFYGLPELEIVRKKGILLDDEVKKQIEEIIDNSSVVDDYVFSPTERIGIIICSIIYLKESIFIEQLMSFCNVSRNTIFNDLSVVESELQQYDLKIIYEPKSGYRIIGDTIKVRAVYILYFNQLYPLYEDNHLSFMNKDEILSNIEILKKMEARLHTNYVHGVITSLAALLPIVIRGGSNLKIKNLRREEIESTKEFSLIQEYYPDMEWVEKIYFCIHLLGSRVTVNSNDIFHERPRQEVYEVTKSLVSEFEKVACVNFHDRENLEQALFAHISASLYRYQYGIQIGDSIADDVIREYPDLFEITRIVSKYLEQMIGLSIPNKEIAFLALHFGAHLTLPDGKGKHLRILIVCVNGISTGNMIRREIKKLLPDCEIVAVKSVKSITNVQKICDVIISTVKMKSVVPVITINPIMTKKDREQILSHPRIKNHVMKLDVNYLMEEISPYIQEKDRDSVKKKIEACLSHNSNISMSASYKSEKVGLLELLQNNRIKIIEETNSWIKALWKAGKKLLEDGSIEGKYIDMIISQLQYYGPYMFITPGVILAHAKPEDGVNRLDASMFIYRKPVVFTDFYKAHIIILLAAPDQEKHLKILRDIADIFSIQSRIDDLINLPDEDSVLDYLKKFSMIEEKE